MTTKKPTQAEPAATPAATMKRCNYFMPMNMVEGLEKVATKKRKSSAEIVRGAVRACLRRHGISV